MSGLFANLGFAAPLALIALVALPAIWLLLRVTPPAPRHIVFPPLKLFAAIAARRETPTRTPWQLTVLRLLLAACIILAVAGPSWNPKPDAPDAAPPGSPLALVIDNGAAAARDWTRRMDLARRLVDDAGHAGSPVAVFATAEPAVAPTLETAAAASRRLGALAPRSYAPDRAAWRDQIAAFLAAQPAAHVAWISDALDVRPALAAPEGRPGAAPPASSAITARAFGDALAAALSPSAAERLRIYGDAPAAGFALAGADNGADGLEAHVLRVGDAAPEARGLVRAVDARGLPLGEATFGMPAGARETKARLELPVEVRNRAARVEVVGQGSALAVTLLDRNNRRRRVGIVTGVSVDQVQPLLSPTWYVDRALAPSAEIREPRMGASEAVNALIDERASVIVLADVGALEPSVRRRLVQWVQAGGVLLRFAGPRLAGADLAGGDLAGAGLARADLARPDLGGPDGAHDGLTPVRLRGDGRNLGGALSWETPKNLAPFDRNGPFAGIETPGEITVRRQLLAEPDGDLPGRTWASLSDGTPVVTARRDGAGLLVLFHVTADPSWSSLPMSGAFVQMLQRIVAMAPDAAPVIGAASGSDASGEDEEARQPTAETAAEPAPAISGQGKTTLAPRRILDGFGLWRDPPAEARGVPADYAGRASLTHPAGFYGPVAETHAVNVLLPGDALVAANLAPLGARPLEDGGVRDLRGPLLAAALVLFLIDCLAMLILGGLFGAIGARRGKAAGTSAAATRALALALSAGACFALAPAFDAHAQGLLNTPLQLPEGWGPGGPGFGPGRAPYPTPRAAPPPRPRASESEPRAAAGGLSGRDLDAATETRLAYVITGDPQVDAVSKAGLLGLGEALAMRTSFEPAGPVGVDPATDELAFYPVLYWPVVAGRPLPDAAAIRKLDSYMKGGGLVIFDTRDAMTARPGVQTPEGAQLQRMLRTLDVPALEPARRDHVLGKSFYLLDNFPGRYSRGQTWVEALPSGGAAGRAPARGGDGVTPLIITSNDWAAAWAVDADGLPLLPLTPDGTDSEERQREMALRVGVNVVIHALTGNYKADQVHLPALLRRLGQ